MPEAPGRRAGTWSVPPPLVCRFQRASGLLPDLRLHKCRGSWPPREHSGGTAESKQGQGSSPPRQAGSAPEPRDSTDSCRTWWPRHLLPLLKARCWVQEPGPWTSPDPGPALISRGHREKVVELCQFFRIFLARGLGPGSSYPPTSSLCLYKPAHRLPPTHTAAP